MLAPDGSAEDGSAERPLAQRPAGEEPVERRLEVDGLTLVSFEWAGEGAPILLAHGTGFHARVWDAVARRLPGRRVIALDLRGHGRSSKPEPPYHWRRFAEDIVALVRGLDLHGVIGVGHSMGGHTVADAAIQCPDRFTRLVLIDPTIMIAADRASQAGGGFEFVSRRRNEWASPEEMIERFSERFPFNAWHDGVLRDYAVYGLLPAPSGEGYVLACPPVVEAAVYAGRVTPGFDLVSELDRLTIPVDVLRSRAPDPGETPAPFTTSPTMPDLASRLHDGTDLSLPHLSHFIPMEAPDLVARHILRAAEATS